ncbi:ISL3 family transposase [Staphylococcus lutrae]|uniref:ISL3 family transposase n=1 Tax=Staphylococcus lutrae TaxID=155085 RepID=A0AAC9WK00_9STAP|nr:ISL3 family transposase [Staphylococcus lutrae]ARJ51961.1 ISL3 family transposase [Staphylococcus lutrae]ARJ51963.1 ISL3 family transposase [Staphylococcus lutrae]ARJ52002.1 ISL3 family transposase [Staphylococcus lutrae]ARJ52034.1 ISL3 family transposase [Staphylococcus lutrae]
MYNDISEMIGIKVSNLKITECLGIQTFKNVQSLFYKGVLTYQPKGCECCGIKNEQHTVIKNGFRSTRVYMGLILERPSYLVLKKQRFYCKACGQTFTAKTPYIEPRCTISNDVKLMVTRKLATVISEKDIANSVLVSPSTVHRYLKDLGEAVKTQPSDILPQHLSFDEFKSTNDVDSSMSFIYCDSITHDIIDILPDRRKFKLEEYFLRFSRKQREGVKSVSIDMYPPYMSLIQSLFPNADIILDRFHIVQAVNREINHSRVKTMNSFKTKEKPKYNKLKRYWKLLLKSPIELDRVHYHSFRLFNTWHSQYSLVQFLLTFDEEFQLTYEAGHHILETLRSNNIEQLEEALQRSKSLNISNGLKRVINTLIKYIPYISNTIQNPHLTNGPIEGINNKIKLIKRVSYGYRNFYNFRNRILIISRLYVSEYKKRTKQQKIAT